MTVLLDKQVQLSCHSRLPNQISSVQFTLLIRCDFGKDRAIVISSKKLGPDPQSFQGYGDDNPSAPNIGAAMRLWKRQGYGDDTPSAPYIGAIMRMTYVAHANAHATSDAQHINGVKQTEISPAKLAMLRCNHGTNKNCQSPNDICAITSDFQTVTPKLQHPRRAAIKRR